MQRPRHRSLSAHVLLLCFSLAPWVGYAQTISTDTSFVLTAMQNARGLYSRTLGVGSHLLNGIQYREYSPHENDIGNPFFVSDDWVEGSVYYDGQRYDQVAILYDLVREKVVIEHPYSGSKLELITEKIKYFLLPGHHFVRIKADTVANSTISTGFYDLVFDGRTKFYVKRQKIQRDHIIGREILVEFSMGDRLYIYKNGQFFPVKGKSSVLAVLEDRKSDIRKFIRKNKIKVRRNPELAIASIVAFYDESGN